MRKLKNKTYYTYTLMKQTLMNFVFIISSLMLNLNIVNALNYSKGTIGVNDSEVYGTVSVPAIANGIYGQLNAILSGCMGIALITLVLVFVVKCGQLAASGQNAMKRSNHIGGMLWLGIAIASLGFFTATGGVISIIIHLTTGNL